MLALLLAPCKLENEDSDLLSRTGRNRPAWIVGLVFRCGRAATATATVFVLSSTVRMFAQRSTIFEHYSRWTSSNDTAVVSVDNPLPILLWHDHNTVRQGLMCLRSLACMRACCRARGGMHALCPALSKNTIYLFRLGNLHL